MNGKMDIISIFNRLHMSDQEWFMTGSRALDNYESKYVISTDKSDYDFVVSIQHRHHILNYLTAQNIKIDFSNYNGGFKFSINNKIYNIITAIDIEFRVWKEALGIMRYLIKTDKSYRKAIANKRIRYSIYEQLRGICKSTLTIGELL